MIFIGSVSPVDAVIWPKHKVITKCRSKIYFKIYLAKIVMFFIEKKSRNKTQH